MSVHVYLYVFLKGKTLKAVTVPETLSNKLICYPLFLAFWLFVHSNFTSVMALIRSEAVLKHCIHFVQSEGT